MPPSSSIARITNQHGRPTASSAGTPVSRAAASFHETIAGFSGNAFLIQSIQQHNRLRRLIETAWPTILPMLERGEPLVELGDQPGIAPA